MQALICFEAVARYKSMKEAAEALGITASAVSQQITRLENAVNVRLFTRSPRFLALTPEGVSYLRVVQPAFRQISQATQRLLDDATVERVTFSCPAEFAILHLLPRLAEFEHARPGAEVLINATRRVVDLNEEEIDFAVYEQAPETPGWVSHPLPDGRWLVYDKTTLQQPVCQHFRDWLLSARSVEPL